MDADVASIIRQALPMRAVDLELLGVAATFGPLDGAQQGELGRHGGDGVVLLLLAGLVLSLERLQELLQLRVRALEAGAYTRPLFSLT